MTDGLALIALASLLSLAGCAADAGSPTTSLLTECSARYLCWNSGYPYDITLSRTQSGCSFRAALLSEDGLVRNVASKAEIGHWTSTDTGLEVCEHERCFSCEQLAAPSTTGAQPSSLKKVSPPSNSGTGSVDLGS